jgi:hypothetical protein
MAMQGLKAETEKYAELPQTFGDRREEEPSMLHDSDVVWPLDEERESCYRKEGGHVIIQTRPT